jgi:hypothetical protein
MEDGIAEERLETAGGAPTGGVDRDLLGRADLVSQVVVGAGLGAVLLSFAFRHGGFEPTLWMPATLFLLGVLVVVVVARPELVHRVTGARLVSVAAFAAFTAWSFLSIVWAEAPADAWDGANRTLLYLVAFTLVVLSPWSVTGAAVVLGALSVGVAVAGVSELVRATSSSRPLDFFNDGFFVEPMGYHNANAALLLLGFWPLLFLASRAEVPRALRPLLLASAGVLLELALIAQSRGSAIAFCLSAALFFILVPARVRSALWLAPPVAVVAAALPRLVDLRSDALDGDVAPTLDGVLELVALSAVGLLVAGAVLVALERRISLGPRLVTATGRVLAVLAISTIAVVAAAVLGRHPLARADAAWTNFKSPSRATTDGVHLLSGLGSNRYDFWRVSLGEFATTPVVGIGADNFAVPYLRDRRSGEEPLYPHSVQLAVLSQTGLVGTALLLAALVAALLSAAGTRRMPTFARGVAAVATVTFGYWLVHTSGDWLWEVPGLGAWALVALGLAVSLGAPRRLARAQPSLRRRVGSFVGLALVAAAAASILLPWLAAREIERARGVWRTDPGEAYERLERARRLNPLSARPDLIAGAIAARRRDWDGMRVAFERATERNPASWYAHLELAVAASGRGDRAAALASLARATALNPNEPVVDIVRDAILRDRALTPAQVDRYFVERVAERSR